MKREYAAPKLVEYGRLETLTLGSGSFAPDYTGTFPNLISDSSNCSDPKAILCVVGS